MAQDAIGVANTFSMAGRHSAEQAPKLSGALNVSGPAPSSLGQGIVISSAGELSKEDISDLVLERVDAVIVRNLIPQALAHDLANRVLSAGETTRYSNLRDNLEKIGSTLFEHVATEHSASKGAIEHYLKSAKVMRSFLSKLWAPVGVSPHDTISSLLERKLGAQVLRLHGQDCFFGLLRVVRDGGEILPHHDFLGEDIPSFSFAQELSRPGAGQLAMNLYLELPEEGGELTLWRDRSLFNSSSRESSSDYGLALSGLPPPDLTILPEPGDLVLFNSMRVHAVTKVIGRTRVSVSLFLGVPPEGDAFFWS